MGWISVILYLFLCGMVVWAILVGRMVHPMALLLIAFMFYTFGYYTKKSNE